MQEQGSSIPNQPAVIMVAAGPQDERAITLVQAMRQAGLRVTFAETVSIAVRASEAAACVTVLRPDTWKTQAIATVMRAKPDCLIPVLAEPMNLPRGPWTQPAISLVDDAEQGEQKLIQTVRDYLDTRPAPIERQIAAPLTINNLLTFKKRRRRIGAGPILTTILLLVILALGGLLGYFYYTNLPGKGAAANALHGLPNTTPRVVYNAATPGKYCDSGSGQWSQSGRYVKTVNKQKTEVIDKYSTLQCQKDGSLVTRSGDYHFYSTVFFDGVSQTQPLAPHYFAQIDAAITSGDAQADVSMEAHDDTGYGRYRFDVSTLGHWSINICNAVDGSPINLLATGFLSKASKTYTLAIEVNGPVMTFSIDGAQLATVTDTTYPSNDAVSFGVNDWSASAPISALFSNFKYEELTPSTLTTSAIVATATAQTQVSMQAPYSARIPGYGCDTGAGQWQPMDDTDPSGTLMCLSNGMQLTAPANAKTLTEENFYWLNGRFSQNYKVSTQIDLSHTTNACAGLETHVDSNGDSYIFTICPNGSWKIDFATNKTQVTLAQGTVNAQNTYTITAQADGSAQSLFINDQLIKTVNDSHLTSTDHISLFAGYYQSSQSQSAIFSNFIFTPLA